MQEKRWNDCILGSKIILIIAFWVQSNQSHAGRNDSIPFQRSIGYNVFPGLPNLEAGLNLEQRISNNIFLELSYYHAFAEFRIMKSGGSGIGWIYNPWISNKVSVGLRFYHVHKKHPDRVYFLDYRLGYKNSQVPTYMNRDGSNGLNGSRREVLSIYYDRYRASFGAGERQVYRKHFFAEESVAIGVQYVSQSDHLYSKGDARQRPVKDHERFRHRRYFFPLIEFSLKLGYCF